MFAPCKEESAQLTDSRDGSSTGCGFEQEQFVMTGAVNFRDVMIATGRVSREMLSEDRSDNLLGFEFSGVQVRTPAATDAYYWLLYGLTCCASSDIEPSKRWKCRSYQLHLVCKQVTAACKSVLLQEDGSRVMGPGQNVIATRTAVPRHYLFKVPNGWTLAEAATVPVAYMTAYYALVMRGQLRAGMRVLIHSAAGAVGLASLHICHNRGAQVDLILCRPQLFLYYAVIKGAACHAQYTQCGVARDSIVEESVDYR